MEVFQGIERYPTGFGAVAATVGNYDGLHLGHRKIIDAIRERAKQAGARSLVITFEPHPATIVAPAHAPSLLFTRRQKIDALTESGVDAVLILEFDAAVAALGGREFFEQWLLPRIEFLTIEIGTNFRFGRDRSGDLALLHELGAEHNFKVHGHDAMKVDDTPVSSSQVRQAIREGAGGKYGVHVPKPSATEEHGTEFVPCELGLDNGNYSEVRSGLEEGMVVYTKLPAKTNRDKDK